ncbi:hypothetical protein D3C79_529120 [compost metagenome]
MRHAMASKNIAGRIADELYDEAKWWVIRKLRPDGIDLPTWPSALRLPSMPSLPSPPRSTCPSSANEYTLLTNVTRAYASQDEAAGRRHVHRIAPGRGRLALCLYQLPVPAVRQAASWRSGRGNTVPRVRPAHGATGTRHPARWQRDLRLDRQEVRPTPCIPAAPLPGVDVRDID